MDIRAEVEAFDGRRTASLESLAERLDPTETVLHELLDLAHLDDAKAQSASTWLLKRVQEDGHLFSTEDTGTLLSLLCDVSHWEARLHLLQLLPGLSIPPERVESVRRALDSDAFLKSPNKLVRAWSYNGIAILADQNPKLRPAVIGLLSAAQEGEAASVRARVRAILKNMSWTRAD
ncbi:MAG: hypothetical protein AAF942_07235 [Pseudomonadota bacterium]